MKLPHTAKAVTVLWPTANPLPVNIGHRAATVHIHANPWNAQAMNSSVSGYDILYKNYVK